MRAQIDPSLPEQCHDFDFFLGEWESTITTRGRSEPLAGRWSARHLHGGRMVVDDLQILDANGLPVRTMATIRTWVPERGTWTAVFRYALEQPTLVELDGHRVGEEIHLTARHHRSGATAAVRFFAIDDSSFQWEQRDDAGQVVVHIACRRAVVR
jgi:hypothetical protein